VALLSLDQRGSLKRFELAGCSDWRLPETTQNFSVHWGHDCYAATFINQIASSLILLHHSNRSSPLTAPGVGPSAH